MRYRFIIGLMLILPVLALAGAGPSHAGSDPYRYGGSGDRDYRYGDYNRDYDRDYDGNRYGGGYGQLPGGNWRFTCRDITVRGSALYAECRRNNGSWEHASVDLNDCRGGLVNDNGNLECAQRRVAALPNGSFRDSCRNERIEQGYLLVARCADWRGQYRKTALDLRTCARGDIQNRGGVLVCRGRGGGAWWSHNG